MIEYISKSHWALFQGDMLTLQKWPTIFVVPKDAQCSETYLKSDSEKKSYNKIIILSFWDSETLTSDTRQPVS